MSGLADCPTRLSLPLNIKQPCAETLKAVGNDNVSPEHSPRKRFKPYTLKNRRRRIRSVGSEFRNPQFKLL